MAEDSQNIDDGLPERASRTRARLLGVAKVTFAALLIYYLVRRGDIKLADLSKALVSHWYLTFLATVFVIVSYAGQAFRWDVILRNRSVHVPYWQAMRYLMIGKFFNLAVPGYFSEDIVRALYVVRQNAGPRSRVFISLAADRLIGISSLFLVGAAGLVVRSFGGQPASSDTRLASLRALALLAVFGFAAAVFILSRVPRLPRFVVALAARLNQARRVEDAYSELRHYCCSPRLQSKVLGISLVNHGAMVASFVVFGHALGMRVSVADYCIFVPLGILLTMIPIAPVGLGVGHVAFLTLFRIAASDQGANLFSLYTAVCILLNLVGGLFYVGLGARESAQTAAAR